MSTAPDLPAHGVQGAERRGWQHELLVVLVVIFQREFHFVERMFQQHSAMVNLCKFRPVSCPPTIIYNCTEPQHLNHGFTDGVGEG